MKFYHAFIVAPLLMAVSVTPKRFLHCGTIPTPLAFNIVGCDPYRSNTKCVIKRGSTMNINMTVAITHPEDSYDIFINFIDNMENVYYDPVYYKGMCKALLDNQCPLQQSNRYTVGINFPIIRFFPLSRWLAITFEIVGKRTGPIACIEVNPSFED